MQRTRPFTESKLTGILLIRQALLT